VCCLHVWCSAHPAYVVIAESSPSICPPLGRDAVRQSQRTERPDVEASPGLDILMGVDAVPDGAQAYPYRMTSRVVWVCREPIRIRESSGRRTAAVQVERSERWACGQSRPNGRRRRSTGRGHRAVGAAPTVDERLGRAETSKAVVVGGQEAVRRRGVGAGHARWPRWRSARASRARAAPECA
jgi:hypothetical protein